MKHIIIKVVKVGEKKNESIVNKMTRSKNVNYSETRKK